MWFHIMTDSVIIVCSRAYSINSDKEMIDYCARSPVGHQIIDIEDNEVGRAQYGSH
jgi:hypothetical protein